MKPEVLPVPLIRHRLVPEILDIVRAAIAERVKVIHLARLNIPLFLWYVVVVIDFGVRLFRDASVRLGVGAVYLVNRGWAFPTRRQVMWATDRHQKQTSSN